MSTHATAVDLAKLDTRFAVLKRRDSESARAYRTLRHRLFVQGNPRVIAIASVDGGEGKTSTALNLVTVLAEEAETRVLLVEGNTISPILATLFQTDHPPDLNLRLRLPRASPEPWPVLTFEGALPFHAAVMLPEAGPQHLDRALFAELIDAMRREYDYIVVDTPALSKGADGSVASSLSDGVVLSARAGKTSARALEAAADKLRPAPVHGVVLHGVSDEEASLA